MMAQEEPAASVEWRKAQQVQISVDLIAAAKRELGFLAAVSSTHALKDPQVLKRAIDRYLNCWLPLASEYEPAALLPPFDCAWVWHCHKLNPVQYAKDCQELFKKLVDVAVPDPSRTMEVEALSIRAWELVYPGVPYHYIRVGQHAPEQQNSFDPLPNSKTVAYDLVNAIGRQSSFYFQVSRSWMYEDRFLTNALERYRGFLYFIKLALEKQAKGGPRPFVVPTYDIDLLWHSHQLSPAAYRADTIKCIGKILDHDDSDSNREAGAKLNTSFLDTCAAWLATYGTVYEQAGSLYRGSEPGRSAPPSVGNPVEVVTGYPVNQQPPRIAEENRTLSLSHRQTVQVNLVVFGAGNVRPTSKSGRMSLFYVRVSALRKCPMLKLTTSPIECSSIEEVTWNEGFSFQAELSTKGLRMELMSYSVKKTVEQTRGFLEKLQRRMPSFNKKAKCLGEISIDYRDLLGSSTGLSFTKWATMVPTSSKKNGSVLPQLHFSVSITPPTPAPHIFRMLPAPVTDDQGLQVAKFVPKNKVRQQGRWVTRTVVDHTGKEQFVVRARWATGVKINDTEPARVSGADSIIQVHKGALEKLRYSEMSNYQHQDLIRAPPFVLSSANQLAGRPGDNERKWSLSHSGVLTVAKPSAFYAPLSCEIQGNVGYPMRLLSGRWLDYEVPGAREMDEAKYLTLIRYTPDAPMGKATALINWHSAAIEVRPEESVVSVVLISTTISMSLLDMKFIPPTERAPSKVKFVPSDGHLGAMLIQTNGLSSLYSRHTNRDIYWEANNTLLFYSFFWWELTSTQIYLSGAGGAVCGGGAGSGGTCGGGACGSAGGCGGGACAGGCGSGGGCGGCGGG